MKYLLLILCLLSIPAYAANIAPLDIASIKTGRKLILFWRSDCAPCITEMGFLPEIANGYPGLDIALIALQDKDAAINHLPENLPRNVKIYIANKNQKEVLAAFGNDKTALPFSIFQRENGSICDKNYGILGLRKTNKWVKIC